jgi:hypothetical protein
MTKLSERPVAVVPPNALDDTLPTLDFDAAAAYAQALTGRPITVRYIRQECYEHRLPRFILSGRVRFSKSDVRYWLESLRRTGTKRDA